jgi:hypothetical protein
MQWAFCALELFRDMMEFYKLLALPRKRQIQITICVRSHIPDARLTVRLLRLSCFVWEHIGSESYLALRSRVTCALGVRTALSDTGYAPNNRLLPSLTLDMSGMTVFCHLSHWICTEWQVSLNSDTGYAPKDKLLSSLTLDMCWMTSFSHLW